MSDKKAPKGLGLFIWEPNACEGGDWDHIIAKTKECKISWLVMHNFFPSSDLVAKLKAGGVYVAASIYVTPTNQSVAVARSRNLVSLGADAILFDAELEWETDPGTGRPKYWGNEATAFIKALRDAVGSDMWLGNAGAWQHPKQHPEYPDKEFSAVCDGALPEVYWSEYRSNISYAEAVASYEEQWKTYADVQGYKAVIPIGSAYGTNAGSLGGGNQPLKLDDLSDFVRKHETCALWSWKHLEAITGGFDALKTGR